MEVPFQHKKIIVRIIQSLIGIAVIVVFLIFDIDVCSDDGIHNVEDNQSVNNESILSEPIPMLPQICSVESGARAEYDYSAIDKRFQLIDRDRLDGSYQNRSVSAFSPKAPLPNDIEPLEIVYYCQCSKKTESASLVNSTQTILDIEEQIEPEPLPPSKVSFFQKGAQHLKRSGERLKQLFLSKE